MKLPVAPLFIYSQLNPNMVLVEEAIALMGIILFIGFFAEVVFRRFSIPSVLILLAIGVILGPLTLTLPSKTLSEYASLFAPIALIIILFQGGLNMRISDLFKEGPLALLLASGHVLLSSILLSVSLHYLLGWEWVTGAILGAIVGGTSSPIIIPIVSASRARQELKDLVSLESIATDVLCIVLAIALIGVALGNGTQENFIANIARQIFTAFSTGMVVGVIGSLFWLLMLKRAGRTSVDYILTLGFIFITYYVSQMLGGNGAITALTFGLVIGNITYLSQKLGNDMFNIDYIPIKQFHEEISFFIRTFFLVYLGIIVSLGNINALLLGAGIGVLLVAIRPLVVRALLFKTGFTQKEKTIISSLSARGLSAALLASIPVSLGVPGSEPFSDIVFTVIIVTVVFTGVTYFMACKAPEQKGSSDKPTSNKMQSDE